MAVRSRSSGWIDTAAVSWRLVSQRFSFLIFIGLSLGLLVLGRVQPLLIEGARVHAIDGLAPVLDAFARPLTAGQNAVANVKSYFNLRQENEALRIDNAQMKQWQNAIVSMQRENKELRNLLHFKVEPGLSYISARVIADTGGPFVRGLIITAGRTDGVREGMAAMTGEGLVGRVVEVGDWSSRVLLISDLNSRIPVIVSDTGDRAILAGDNSAEPKLLYFSQDAVLNPGARVVTSGHGGVFPAGLLLGTVRETGHGTYSIVPAADLGRINYIRLVDFNLKGGSFNSIANKLQAETQKR